MVKRMRKAQVQVTHGVAYDVLAQEVLKNADFQQMINQLGVKLRQDLLQQLVQQPLRQFGTALGRDVQAGLGESFAPSESQVGALFHELLGQAEGIL